MFDLCIKWRNVRLTRQPEWSLYRKHIPCAIFFNISIRLYWHDNKNIFPVFIIKYINDYAHFYLLKYFMYIYIYIYIYIHTHTHTHIYICIYIYICSVGHGSRIHWLQRCTGVTPPSRGFFLYDTKQSEVEALTLELLRLWGTPSLLFLLGPLFKISSTCRVTIQGSNRNIKLFPVLDTI